MFMIITKVAGVFVRVLAKVKEVAVLGKQPLVEMGIKALGDKIKKRKKSEDGKETQANS